MNDSLAKKVDKNKSKKRAEDIEIESIVYTLLLFIIGLSIIIISSLLIPHHFNYVQNEYPATNIDNSLFLFTVALSVVNITLVLYLIYIYIKDYLILKTNFTLGLLAFLFSFLLYSLSTLPFHGLGIEEGFETFASVLPMLFSAIGLLIFLKIGSE